MEALEALRAVDACFEVVVDELDAYLVIGARDFLEDLKLFDCALNLRNSEPGSRLFFKSFMLGRWRSDIVEDALVNCEIHEIDAELTLNFCLFFD